MNRLKYINNRILKERCLDIEKKLSNVSLIELYKKSPSIQKNIDNINMIMYNGNKLTLSKGTMNNEEKTNFINQYVLELISDSTKDIMRENIFNKLVKENILNLLKSEDKRFQVYFENSKFFLQSQEILPYSYIPNFKENPDWCIYDNKTGKIMLGINQLDICNGGDRIENISHYIIENKFNSKNYKFVCVVQNNITLTNEENKLYKLFDIGFNNNTLCYINGLEKIVNSFFK